MSNGTFWQNKIKAFLHDPPDKALNLSGHEERAKELLKVLGLDLDIEMNFDYWASSMQRIPITSEDQDKVIIDFHRTNKELHPYFKHPISAEKKEYEGIRSLVLGTTKMKTSQVVNEVLKKEKEVLEKLKDDDPKQMYFKIWRFFKEKLKEELGRITSSSISEELVNLPADTRCPDHTIWDHLDASAAIYSAIAGGTPALLLFKISPVQRFISAARKEADLWAGSHLLSWITFKAMMVVVERYGPDSIIFPHLRGQPFFDLENFPEESSITPDKVKIANIPNRFLAIISFKKDEELKNLKKEIEEEIHKILEDLAKKSLDKIGLSDPITKEKCKEVVKNYFKITVEALPVPVDESELQNSGTAGSYDKLADFVNDLDIPFGTKEKYKKWLEILKDMSKYSAKPMDLYGLMFEVLEAIVGYESSKFEKSIQPSGYKCTMCGEVLAIKGEEKYQDMKSFWDNLAKEKPEIIKRGEYLCPICVIKRFYRELFGDLFTKKTGKPFDVSFKSVVDVALSKTVVDEKTYYDFIKESSKYDEFIKLRSELFKKLNEKTNIELSNREKISREWYFIDRLNTKSILSDLIHDKEVVKSLLKDEEITDLINELRKIVEEIHREIENKAGKHLTQPKYYAILVMDGDNMGKMLIGDDMKNIEDYLHHQAKIYLISKGTRTKRLITPATHSAISRALMHFSVNKVREIVRNNKGELIYAGGDDVLALLPVDKALKCAYEIQKEFNKSFDGWELLPSRTMSAGILISHYLHPLQDALERARSLEKMAKQSGRNAFFIGYLTRSGQYSVAGADWKILENEGLKNTVKYLIEGKISKRFIYDVLSMAENVPPEAVKAYITYELERHSEGNTVNLEKLVESLKTALEYIRIEEPQGCRLKSLALLLKILFECDSQLEVIK